MSLAVAPFRLFEVKVKVPLYSVEFMKAAFGKTPEVFNTVDMNTLVFRKFILLMAHPIMAVITYVHQTVITTPFIRIDDGRGIDFPLNNGLQNLLFNALGSLSLYFIANLRAFLT